MMNELALNTDNNHFGIPLLGVESEHCALIVDKVLGKVRGVQKHHVDLNNGRAVIQTDAHSEILKNVVKSIRESGYGVATIKRQFPVTAMSCASCAVSVESVLNEQKGVVMAKVN
ncbi:MAG TPA: cation transporter, partial [Puia sp.]|nr:cation transporter [Puia sp.]